MRNKILYTLFAIIFLAGFVSANTYQLKLVPEWFKLSQDGEYDNFLGGYYVYSWINGSNIVDDNISTFGYPNGTGAQISSITANFSISPDINLSDSSFYFIIENQTEIYVTPSLPLTLLEVLNNGSYNYVSFLIYAFEGYGRPNNQIYGFNRTALDIGTYPWTDITGRIGSYEDNGYRIYAIVLNLSYSSPKQNIQTVNYEVLSASGYGISAFLGGLLSGGLFGFIMAILMILLIAIVIGAIVAGMVYLFKSIFRKR